MDNSTNATKPLLPALATNSLPGAENLTVTTNTTNSFLPPGVNVTSSGNFTLPNKAEVTLPGGKEIPTVENTTSTIVNNNNSIPENAVRTTLKMDGNFADFQKSGGQAKFTTALATNLGINASQITIINAYEGSIVLLYDITAAEG